MIRIATGPAIAGALLLAAAPLSAQAPCGGKLATAEVGREATYHLTRPEGIQEIRFAITGQATKGDAHPVWFETQVQASARPTMVLRVLVPGFPYEPTAVTEGSLQSGDQTPLKFDARQLAAMHRRLPGLLQSIVDGCKSASLVGTETVKVPAGTFQASHYRNALRGSDIWVSSEVPFGLVKLSDPSDTTAMVLTGKK
jgi:hypothetical protein